MPLLNLQWYMNLGIQRKRFGNWQTLDFFCHSEIQRAMCKWRFSIPRGKQLRGPWALWWICLFHHMCRHLKWICMEKLCWWRFMTASSLAHLAFLWLPLASSLPKARCTQRETTSAPFLCDRKAPAKSQALKASQQSDSSAISQATRAHHSGVRWATSFKANGTQPLAKDANITRSPHPQRFHKVHSAACATWMSWEGAACKRMTPSVSWSFKPQSTLRSSSSAAATQAASKRVSNCSEDSLCASCSLCESPKGRSQKEQKKSNTTEHQIDSILIVLVISWLCKWAVKLDQLWCLANF